MLVGATKTFPGRSHSLRYVCGPAVLVALAVYYCVPHSSSQDPALLLSQSIY